MSEDQQESVVEQFALPEDFIPTPVPLAVLEEQAGVLGATGLPPTAEGYGGVGLDVYDDAYGNTFLIICGERGEGRKFGTYCILYPAGGGGPKWLELPGFTEGRAGTAERPNGLYVAWLEHGGRSWSRYKVPGYVTPGFPSSGQQIPPAPLPVTTTPPASSFRDGEAHQQIGSLRKQLAAAETTIKALTAQVQQLQARPAQALDWRTIRTWLWEDTESKNGVIADKVYFDLLRDDSGIKQVIRELIAVEVERQLAPARPQQAGEGGGNG